MTQASNGKFYGTTNTGGAGGNGTLFELTTAGALTTLYNFCSQPTCANPNSTLIQASDGNLYGTVRGTGSTGGSIFKSTLSGELTTLYSFCSQPNCSDGNIPQGVVQATNGKFYGITIGGGANNSGTVFELTASGELTTLYSFCSQPSCADGSGPSGQLLQATDGTFYGATQYGGAGCSEILCGTVFSLSVGLRPFIETVPGSAAAGAKVTLLGNNLTGTTGVTFNGVPATYSVVSNTAIVATVPHGGTTGIVTVTTASGGVLDSNVPFRVLP